MFTKVRCRGFGSSYCCLNVSSISDIEREEYDTDKNIITSRVEQNKMKLMKFDSTIKENRNDLNALKAKTVKRCKYYTA